MHQLDDSQYVRTIDIDHMLTRVTELPQTCTDAWKLVQNLDLPAPRVFNHVVVAGMGGSAIGADLAAALVADQCATPILTMRGYDLPAFVSGPKSLVIAASHSGNTEETLQTVKLAHERGASLAAISTGGQIARLAHKWEIPLITFDYPSQPRAALGYSFTLLLGLLSRLGLVEDQESAMVQAVKAMDEWKAEIGPDIPLVDNPAKKLALELIDRLPVVYGAGLLEPVARRWKTQFNENSKSWAFFENMPELNHNAVVAYEHSESWRELVTVLCLLSDYDHPRTSARWRITRQLLEQEQIRCIQIEARGLGRLAQMLSFIYFGDFVSVYLALAQGIDPTPVGPIANLKAKLADLTD